MAIPRKNFGFRRFRCGIADLGREFPCPDPDQPESLPTLAAVCS
jgi:hypothetical protein